MGTYLGVGVWEERIEPGVQNFHLISPVLLYDPSFYFG